jgi:hypothetical protein
VTCCKQHKEVCSGKKNPEEEKAKKAPLFLSALPVLRGYENNVNVDDDDDDESLDEGWKITESMKSALNHSEWLREELKDGGLRELISQIVVSKNTQALLQVQERYPSFRVFQDKLLVVADVLERQEDEDEPLNDWLERHWSEEESPPMLTLKPIPRSVPVFEPVHASSSSSSGASESEDESSSTTGSSSEDEDEDSEDSSGDDE